MNAKHVALLSLLIAAAALISTASRTPALAQGQAAPASGGAKIATVSTVKIFFGMTEMRDVQAKFKQELGDLEAQAKAREQKVADKRNELELIKPDAPQYEQVSREYLQLAAEHKSWLELNRGITSRNEKLQMKKLFDKITETIAAIAREQGIDLVVSETPGFNIDRMSVQDLTQAMTQREVLYKNAVKDLTLEVTQRLDAQYKAAAK